jgi:hypothetical protein
LGLRNGTFFEKTSTIGNRSTASSWIAPLRPGAVVAVSLITVVGGAGVLSWDRERIITGLVAAAAVLAINVIVVAIRRWHVGNTRLDAAYSHAEDVVRLRSPRANREAAKR